MTKVASEKHYVEVSAEVIRETEKAFQVEAQYWTREDKPVKKAKMWVPKSCSKVVDGKVVGIADFILNQWVQEHKEHIKVHSSLTAAHTRICFDMHEKEVLMNRRKERQDEQRKHLDDIIAKYLPDCTKYSHKLMQELGTIAQTFGRIWKEEGFDANLCDEFISYGEKVNAKYGEPDWVSGYYEKAKGFDEEKRRFILEFPWNTWVFGDFHADYYGREKDFYEVKELMEKKFKKETAVLLEYRSIVERIYNSKKSY